MQSNQHHEQQRNAISKTSVKRSNARVGNLNLRIRTKSENGILCRDDGDISLEEQLISVEKEAINHVMLRNKHHPTPSASGGKDVFVTAIYNYNPTQDDELELHPGDKVRVLSNDFRDSGTEGWWVGVRESQIGVFPMNYVHGEAGWSLVKGEPSASKEGLPEVTPRTPNENLRFQAPMEIVSSSVSQESDDQKNQDTQRLSVCGSTNVRKIPANEIEKLENLGSGTFGVVYHGRWRGRDVAMKTFAMHANEVHIHQEAGHLSCLEHRNIVRLYGVTAADNQLALIMEYAKGGALYNLLHFNRKIKLSPPTLLGMSKQIASGMRYLHQEAKICHRDLKSSNVLIKEAIPRDATDFQIANCTLLITDFGMARRTAELMSQQSKLGTLAYAAPEVCRQQGAFSVKSDVWSYGVLFWELLTKEIPYRDVEHPHLFYKIAFKHHTLHIPEDIPQLLVNLLKSCWNENLDDRPNFDRIVKILNTAERCKFMETCSDEFDMIQERWREEIKRAEAAISVAIEEDEFLEQKRQLESKQEELQKLEMDMQRREAACNQAMGTMMLITVLAANGLSWVPGNESRCTSQSPPAPPPRKRPFVGRLKFWGSSMHYSNTNQQHNSPETFSLPFSDDNSGNPNISHPSNLQHVVHISQQDFNLASPALNFFPDTLKMHTWGPKSQGKIFTNRDRLKSTDEADQENFCPGQLTQEDLSLHTDYADSVESPSPCVDTPSSTCGAVIQSDSNLCASAPNLRKISQGILPVFGFSSFRRPIYDAMKVDEDIDYRKRIPCERCRWKNSNRSATIGPSTVNSNLRSRTDLWDCIPNTPPESLSKKSFQDYSFKNKKCDTPKNVDSRRIKHTKSKKSNKFEWRQVEKALWSVMRMMTAVVLPDRSDEDSSFIAKEDAAFCNLEIPDYSQHNRESCSPTLSIDLPTEDEELSSSNPVDSVFHFLPNSEDKSHDTEMKSDFQTHKNFKPPPSAFKPINFKSSRGRPRPSNHSNWRGSSVPPVLRKPRLPHDKITGVMPPLSVVKSSKKIKENQKDERNYFATWLPQVNSNNDLKNGSHSPMNSDDSCDRQP